MRSRLANALVAVVAAACLTAGMSGTANAAVALGKTSAVDRATARQAALRETCGSGIGLDAPAAVQESAMLCLIGEARQRYGLPSLTTSAPLEESAIEKGRDLLRCNEFSHTACGREFTYWIAESGYMAAECWRVGENLAWGVEDQGTVGSIFKAWMHSPAHRANILGNYEETGLDLRIGQLGGLTSVHIWTQHFGSHCQA